MTGLRSYGDPCGVARALDVIGERWALLIVRELLFGPKRFTDLRAALGASPNVLTQRLGELETAGVVARHRAGGALYDLTDWGRGLHPILRELGLWGARSQHLPVAELGADALMLALEATFVPERAAELAATFELRLDEERFSARVEQGVIAVTRGSPREPDAVIITDRGTLRALVFGDEKLGDARVELKGDARLARTFFRLFRRP
ncbi:MAG TPA: helix-turn-helix domain-containing protein [Polyangiaceae bacterium]